MSRLEYEILKIKFLPLNSYYEISSRNGLAKAFIAKNVASYGVAIENINNIVINEKFVSVNLKNMDFTINNNKFPVLFLSASNDVDIKNFLFLAESFLELKNEKKVLENPIEWVEEWKNMLGDSKKKYRIYDLIGELLTFSYVLKDEPLSHWQASQMGTHDIETPNYSVEVKSTTKKKDCFITVSSAFQLSSDKEEFLYFCRLEKDVNGNYSINSLVDEIVKLGYSKDEIEAELDNLGYSEGTSSRNTTYDALEIRKYHVTKDSFPVIPLIEINKLAPLKNIIGYNITLDLSGIDYEKIK